MLEFRLQVKGELVNGDDKKVEWEGVALANSSLRTKSGRGLSIDKDGEGRRQNACTNEADKIPMITLMGKSNRNEVPLKTVKSFS
jgi:hypothetical protein